VLKRLLMCAALMSALPGMQAQTKTVAAPALAPAAQKMAPIAWLAGTWVAEAKEPGSSNPPSQIVARYTPKLDGTAMSIETSFDGKQAYQGMFGYDTLLKKIAFWYVTPAAESVHGTVVVNGDDSVLDFTMTGLDGDKAKLQTRMHRTDADHFLWELYADPTGSGWVKVFDVKYHRVA
jgi:hypothetical protein